MDKIQGGYRLINLHTGKIITYWNFTETNITTEIIHRVEYLAKLDGTKPDLLSKTSKGDIYQDDGFLAGVYDINVFTRKDYVPGDQASDTDLR